MTPGAYLKRRRQAAGLSIDDVAHAIATVPAIPENGRAEWLMLIEADATPVMWNTLVAIRQVVPFDFLVLERLSLISADETLRPPRLCRICAAADIGKLGLAALHWSESDLCTPCAYDLAVA